MRYLLLPDEERTLIRHLRDVLGLRFLTTDAGAGGSADPTQRITDDFPVLMSSEEREYYFWCSDIGPMRRLGDAPPPRDAQEAAALYINREADPDGWGDRIDLSRTPVISWRRPLWYRSDRGCVVAGKLLSMAAYLKEHPPELRRLYRSVDRWLRKPAVKINPFAHCTSAPIPQPANLSTFWVAAWPKGKEWVDQGGELWPWDG